VQPVESFRAEPLAQRIALFRSQVGCLPYPLDANRQNTSERAKRWRLQFPFRDTDLFRRRLAEVHISEQEFFYILDDESGYPWDAAPAVWFRTLQEAYSSPRPSGLGPLHHTLHHSYPLFSFLRSAEPIIGHFATRFSNDATVMAREYQIVPFDVQDVCRSFVGSLLESFQRMLAQTMILQLNIARLQGELSGESPSERFQSFIDMLGDRVFVMQILREYPVLARQLIRRAEQWLASGLMFLRHFLDDWPTIRESFAGASHPGTLVGVQGPLGDSHRGGRSVLVVCFSSGLRLVYKPRSLQIEQHFQDFLSWLNCRTGDLTFKTLTILNCEDHGWVDFVNAGDCESKDGVRRFYERQGGYLALFYLLNGSDFHCENVIASGEHPVIVDVEALFHPSLGVSTQGIHGVAAGFRENSVLRSGLLPAPMRLGEELQSFDRSGLGAAHSEMSPFALLYPDSNGTDEMRLVRKRLPLRPSAHLPTIAGRFIEELDADAIVRGFVKVYRTFLTHRSDLLDASGPVARFRTDEVRIVLRHTRTYSRLIAESFHPDVLRDALDRDQMFDLLWGDVSERPYLKWIVAAECQDLWNGDVPLFTGRVGSRDVFSSSGVRTPDFLPEPTDMPVCRRIEALSEPDLERQVWLIRASLATLGPVRTNIKHQFSGVRGHTRPENDRARLIAQACRIGDRLEVLAIRSQAEAGWIGLRHDGRDAWVVNPLGPDLYDGTAGIVLFLAYLAAITGEDRYKRLASAGAANLKRQALSARGVEHGIGAFSGWGGLLYVYSHLAALWDRADFIYEANLIVDDLSPLIDQDKAYDIIGGAAGCIGCLLALHALAPSNAMVSAAVHCGDILVRSTCHAEPGLAWLNGLNNVPLAGFSHGVSGIAWALLALSRLSGEIRFRQTALAGLQYERSLFDLETGHWADLRPRDDGRRNSPMTAWCHGAAGIGLARLHNVADDSSETTYREIAHCVATTLASGFGDNHSLCHGDLGNLDFVLQASAALHNENWRVEVERVTRLILNEIEHKGWKCGIGKPIETPGLMTGISGIGYGLLRLAEPEMVPSVLALSPPVAGGRSLSKQNRTTAAAPTL